MECTGRVVDLWLENCRFGSHLARLCVSTLFVVVMGWCEVVFTPNRTGVSVASSFYVKSMYRHEQRSCPAAGFECGSEIGNLVAACFRPWSAIWSLQWILTPNIWTLAKNMNPSGTQLWSVACWWHDQWVKSKSNIPSEVNVGSIWFTFGLNWWAQSGSVCRFHGGPTCLSTLA